MPRRRPPEEDRRARRRRAAVDARHAWQAGQASPDEIVCRLCGRGFRSITYLHLRRIHKFEGPHPIEDYKRRFGLESAVCKSTRRVLRRQREDYWARLGRRWPRERVLGELRLRSRSALPLAWSRLGMSLQLAIGRRFGTWERALRRAGLDPAEHRLRHRWTREVLAAEIRRLRRQNEPLNGRHVQHAHPGLHSAACRLVGNWGSALRLAGFDPRDHPARPPWDIAVAKTWIRERQSSGLPFDASHVPAAILSASQFRVKGGWTALVESMGIAYPGFRPRRGWTEDLVVAELRARRRRGKPLNFAAVAAESQALIHQARERFGSWDAALERAGLDPAIVRRKRRWSRGEVIHAIRRRHAAGRSLWYRDTRRDDPQLVNAARCRFPSSWNRAVRAAGLGRLVRHRAGPLGQ